METTNLNRNKKTKPGIDLRTMVYGKVPPQAKELEEAVLGALLLEKNAIEILIEMNFKPECFYVEANGIIFQAMIEMQQLNVPIDLFTVIEELKRKGQLEAVGGAYYITKLTNAVVSAANIESHARILIQKFIQRELIRIGSEIINDAYDETIDVFDLLDESEAKFFSVTNITSNNTYNHASTIQVKQLNRLDQLRMNPERLSGVTSGYPALDDVTHGWQQTDLIILAARPSVGKTALALNFARNAATNPVKSTGVGFFSLEMSAGQLIQRIWAAESEVKLDKITQGKLDDNDYSILMKKGVTKVDSMPLWIDDTPALNILQFRSKARRMVSKNHVGLIIIDYLQLMSGLGNKNGNREQEISTISRNLKALAKELSIPIIALSQLNRSVETRKESKIPVLADLRESGAIEQDADLVAFIYRPEYYESNTDACENPTGETLVKIAKHRNGSLETIRLKAILSIQQFVPWSGEFTKPEIIMPEANWKPISGNFNKDDDNPF